MSERFNSDRLDFIRPQFKQRSKEELQGNDPSELQYIDFFTRLYEGTTWNDELSHIQEERGKFKARQTLNAWITTAKEEINDDEKLIDKKEFLELPDGTQEEVRILQVTSKDEHNINN